jgi:hypothetical protein
MKLEIERMHHKVGPLVLRVVPKSRCQDLPIIFFYPFCEAGEAEELSLHQTNVNNIKDTMSKVLGKRKATEVETDATEVIDAQEIFRRHFEAQFKPLPVVAPVRVAPALKEDQEDDISDEEESEWDGISEEDGEVNPYSARFILCTLTPVDDNKVEIIDHASTTLQTSTMSKSELKKFMSSRLSDLSSTTTAIVPTPKNTDPQDEDAPSLLANDLALQRLLSESSLLSKAAPNPMFYPSSDTNSNPASRPFAAGKLRLATTDLRLQALGSKTSLLKQAKMPMGMRKGINAAVAGKEAKRRREAKENGIVLEREEKKDAGGRSGGRREGDVDAPAVGRLRGAQLTLSKRDIMSIQGPPTGGGGKNKKSRGRGGSGKKKRR